jgi:hypothetical protein
MTYTFKLARRLAVSRRFVVLIALALVAACMGESTAPEPDLAGAPVTSASLRLSPRTVTVETNQLVRFRGQARSSRGDAVAVPIAWRSTGGAITSDGTFSSTLAGTFKVIGRGRGHKATDTSVVIVVPPAPDLVRLEVTPGSVTLDAGAKSTFTATGYLGDGSTAPVGVVWTASGGSIDPAGAYTADSVAGTFRVIASNTAGTLADTAVVTINPPPAPPAPPPAPTLTDVVITPATVTLASGGSKQFKAYGWNSVGDSISVAVSFAATGGTITSTGLYTAGSTAGTFRVVASTTGIADTAVVTLAKSSSSTGGVGIPFGPFGAWDGETLKPYTDEFTLSMGAYSASNLVTRIGVARSKGQKLMIAMAGGARTNYTTDGVFDMSKWTAKMDTYNTPTIRDAVASAVADGTIVGNTVMDEPFNTGGPGNEANSWGPAGTMTKARVDQMCAYVKAIFPTLPEGVTHDHKDFEPTKSYYICDFILSQYRSAKGDVTAFRDAGLALAQRDGHSIAFSLNILDGGQRDNDNDGVWECPIPLTGGKGTYAPNCRMTPEQVRDFASVLGPAGCALAMWRYDADFMADPANVQAFKDVTQRLSSLPRRSCRRS